MTGYLNYRDLKLQILNVIRAEGPITKQAIAQKLNVNITTITSLVNELLKKYRLLIESGEDISKGGRRPKLYQINKEVGYVAGVDIGGGNIRVVLSDLLGNIQVSGKDKTDSENNKQKILDKTLAMLDKCLKETNLDYKNILGMGMAISGIIQNEIGKVLFCPNIPVLNDFLIKDYIEQKTGIPVFVDDSVRCMAVAEKYYGVATGYDNFMYISLGKGIGIGAFINGEIYRGSMGLAGELGHITVAEDGPVCNCGNRGCLEVMASGPGIIKRAKEGIEKGIVTSISSKIKEEDENISVKLIAKAAEDGDKFAYYLVNRTGEYAGIAIASALNLFGSDLVVLGGGIIESGEIIVSAIERTIKMRALDLISKKVRIMKTALSEYNAAQGAATNFINYIFSDHDHNILRRGHMIINKET